MKMRITQSDIARAAGVHNATVSLALRNSRLIPQPTRDRIQEIARAMGYSPDPALRALVAYRNSRRVRKQLETLVYATNWETKWGWKAVSAHERHYSAAQRKAAELGYQVEHLWLGEPGMTGRRLDRMLTHRNISAMLLASHLHAWDDLAVLDWSRLSAVKLGCFPAPAINQIMVDPFAVTRLALQQVLAKGYQRIGLVLPRRHDDLADRAWSAAFHAELHRWRAREALPVLNLPDFQDACPLDAAEGIQAVTRWYHRHRPEVIIGATPESLGVIRSSGLRVPQDVGYVDLAVEDTGYAVAGVRENSEKVGELAVTMLVNQLEQNILGIPDIATTTSVGGVWREGASLPVRMLTVMDEAETGGAVIKHNLVA
ncbi:MAG TPA: LacI family DNA-binding transcriptional regulator [Lacunisphaera sp.]|nr:LacI family DNA-binding transcriptional regulator [Lacunisphaera sp.]